MMTIFWEMKWPMKSIKPYFQLGLLPEIFTIADLWNPASRVTAAQNLSSGFTEWSCAVVLSTAPGYYIIWNHSAKLDETKTSCWKLENSYKQFWRKTWGKREKLTNWQTDEGLFKGPKYIINLLSYVTSYVFSSNKTCLLPACFVCSLQLPNALRNHWGRRQTLQKDKIIYVVKS